MDDTILDQQRRGGLEQGAPARAFVVAGLCVVGLAIVWVVANLVPIGHRQDALALYDFTQLSRPRLDALANGLLHLLEPAFFCVWAIVLVGVALRRDRPRLAFAVGAIMLLAPLTAELIKPLVAHPHAQVPGVFITAASWPSGHTTAATTLALCAVMVSPQRLRPLVAAIGGVLTVLVAFSLLMLAWHMPSDVFGGVLMGALWASLAVGTLRVLQRRFPARTFARAPSSAVADERSDRTRLGPARPSARSGRGLLGLDGIADGGVSGVQAWGLLVSLASAVLLLGVLLVGTHQAAVAAVVDQRALMVAAAGIAILAATIFAIFTSVMRR